MTQLALALRPKTIDEFIGQQHLVGSNMPLRVALQKKLAFSILFWGPPGVGKTSLARLIAQNLGRDFYELSAVSAGKSELRDIMSSAGNQKQLSENYLAPILFLDEIHRFNKAQQDFLLPYVEEGRVILIGATTENPSFEVIAALLSRTKVFVLDRLSEAELSQIIDGALAYLYKDTGDSIVSAEVTPETREWLINYANGDARRLLNIIEQTSSLYDELTLETLKATLQSSHLRYDKSGEEHYDTISAFIKSMRASNADAALYYLARMVDSGEDPKFIARRMVIFASEDIGLAAPTALVVANTVFDAVHKIGYPEAQISLAHGVAYLCKCKKDRSAYDAYFSALSDVKKHGNLPIPMELRNAPTSLMKNIGYGQGYEMYSKKSLLPQKIKNKKYLSNPQQQVTQ